MENISNRKSSVEFPEIKELEIILEREAKRPVASEKEKDHFANFRLPLQWFELLGLPIDIFEKNFTWQELVVLSAEIQEQVVLRTLKLVQEGNSEIEGLMRKITLYLGEEDKPQQSDIIFVFGSKSLMRIEMAVNLYKQKLAPVIFITGSMPIYEKRENKIVNLALMSSRTESENKTPLMLKEEKELYTHLLNDLIKSRKDILKKTSRATPSRLRRRCSAAWPMPLPRLRPYTTRRLMWQR